MLLERSKDAVEYVVLLLEIFCEIVSFIFWRKQYGEH